MAQRTRPLGALCAIALLSIHFAGACSARVIEVNSGRALPAQAVAMTSAAPVVEISPDRFLAHIAVLAHDDLEGRGTGSPGIDLAAGYIAGQFAAAGLAPGGPDGSYFQPFTIDRSSIWRGRHNLADDAGDEDATPLVARNVVGLLAGSGPHADEFVVIGGHYDHLGVYRERIYNGADDNASGTAGVIEIARALVERRPLDRSVLFVAFSAEEIGLHGSAHYVREPTVDISSIVAMLNMDMIGRLTPDDHANRLAIHGLGTGDSFRRIVERRAEGRNVSFIPDESALGPSDHSSFYKAGVPAMFFFTGIHADYHKPSDDVETVNAAGGAEVAELVCEIALDIIHGDFAPRFAQVDRPARIFRSGNPGVRRVKLGILPDLEDDPDQPGFRVLEVTADGGAGRAGMRSDDVLVSIDVMPIDGRDDFAEALEGKRAGDVVTVIVLRGEAEVTLEVELSSPGGE